MSARKVALITGGARGIGLSTAQLLVRDGWEVVLADRDENALNDAAGTFAARESVHTLPLDVAHVPDAQEKIAGIAGRLGRLDGLVNNAGIFRNEPFFDITEEGYDRLMAVNLKGAFFVMQAAAREMKRFGNGGVIVNLSSSAGRSGRPTQTIYGLTKAGLIHLTKSAALALAPDVRVLAVCPAAIETSMWEQTLRERRAVGGDADVDAFFARLPLKRSGKPEEVAELIAFLMSDRSSFTTGATYDICGGLEM
ncbi:MAG: SDR family oxidoreductase [Capsulimonadales bacterium]|nr:SDR family oxidoreductase [Capsulimonadales bacterium]